MRQNILSQSTSPSHSSASLTTAHALHHQLQANASLVYQQDAWRQGSSVFLAVLATALAVLPCLMPDATNLWFLPVCRVGLAVVGLSLTLVIGVSNRLQEGQVWLTLAGGAAATERAIYIYRTLLQYTPARNVWLSQQVAGIQQHVQERLGSTWVMRPTAFTPDEITTEDQNLLADGYLTDRITPQQERSEQQLAQLSATRSLYQWVSLLCGGIVVLLPLLSPAGLGGSAIAATLALAFLFWLKLSSLNRWIEIHSQLILGLTLLRDFWQSLPVLERTGSAFFRLVWESETLIESPYQQMADQVKTAVHALHHPQPDLIHTILSQPIPSDFEHALRGTLAPTSVLVQLLDSQMEMDTQLDTQIADRTTTPNGKAAEAEAEAEAMASAESTITHHVEATKTHAESNLEATTSQVLATVTNGNVVPSAIAKAPPLPSPPPVKRGRPHAFVVMPFGRKQGPDGRWIDFNSIYQTLIKPAIEEAGLESFRADEESSSGDIITDMFQELLLADMVVADLSIDNANVFYELGIRHAMRRRGVVHIQAGRAYMPFDIITVRTLPYHCDESGCPDPLFVEKDKQALSKMIQATWISERNRVHSPIFNMLTGMIEPDRKTLRTPLATGYWQEYTTLQARIEIAQRQKRIGDVVLLAEEVSNPLIKEDILAEAGKALKSVGNSALALKQYRQGLKINPDNVAFRCEEAYHLSRLGQSDEAIVKLERLLEDIPHCVDAATYLARIYKDLWRKTWIGISDEAQRIQVAYEASFILQKSIESYLRGYQLDQNQYYPGINALTLTALLDHLATIAEIDSGDADEAAYRNRLSALKGSIQFCLESNLRRLPNDQWACLSLSDLAVCVAESPHQVATAYRKALAVLWNNKYGLQATLDQLQLMNLLKFRPAHVQAGIGVIQAELDRFEQQERLFASTETEEETTKPAQVFLFTGHMVDSPSRSKPRFPAAMEPEVTKRLDEALTKLEARSNCIAIIPGLACGGDMLFVEACLKRDMQVEIYLPFEASEFIQDSVNFAGDSWVRRFHAILDHPHTTLNLQPDRLGPVPADDNAYGRNNRWALYATLMHDISRVRLIALWNGQGGDGPGGTADMVQQVRQLGGIVEHIDITKFDYWREQAIALATNQD